MPEKHKESEHHHSGTRREPQNHAIPDVRFFDTASIDRVVIQDQNRPLIPEEEPKKEPIPEPAADEKEPEETPQNEQDTPIPSPAEPLIPTAEEPAADFSPDDLIDFFVDDIPAPAENAEVSADVSAEIKEPETDISIEVLKTESSPAAETAEAMPILFDIADDPAPEQETGAEASTPTVVFPEETDSDNEMVPISETIHVSETAPVSDAVSIPETISETETVSVTDTVSVSETEIKQEIRHTAEPAPHHTPRRRPLRRPVMDSSSPVPEKQVPPAEVPAKQEEPKIELPADAEIPAHQEPAEAVTGSAPDVSVPGPGADDLPDLSLDGFAPPIDFQAEDTTVENGSSETDAASREDSADTESFPIIGPSHGEKRLLPKILGGFVACLVLLFFAYIAALVLHRSGVPGYQILANGVPVGYVTDTALAEEQLKSVRAELEKQDITPAELTLSYQPAEISPDQIMSEDSLYHALYVHASADYTRGYTIYADGAVIGYTASADHLDELFATCDKIRGDALSPEILSGGILERTSSVTWEYGWIPGAQIESEDALMIRICDAKLLSYQVVTAVSEACVIPYGTTYRENDAGFDGYTTLISEGRDGLARVTTRRILDPDTGAVLSEEETEHVVLREPVDAVAYYGTYPLLDESVSTGTFIWPLLEPTPENLHYTNEEIGWSNSIPRVYMSSGYGERDLWGTTDFHLGYDIAASAYTEIYACDGGVVTYASYSGSYGYAVRILHKDGVETLYAHQAKMAVKAGDVVTQGQLIGYVGSSGNTSGSHLHLEFRKNHVTVDPALYIDIPEWITYIGG
ncbi:MAG: peptidoglycan DD-metalloendopeptidase family protein [Clostridia bacterium]|nr:peptidoglycan DD-metalloendopeptidase family protein [Clostridia bacterium]